MTHTYPPPHMTQVGPGDHLCDVETDKATMGWESQEEVCAHVSSSSYDTHMYPPPHMGVSGGGMCCVCVCVCVFTEVCLECVCVCMCVFVCVLYASSLGVCVCLRLLF
jgi:hypothetical protein